MCSTIRTTPIFSEDTKGKTIAKESAKAEREFKGIVPDEIKMSLKIRDFANGVKENVSGGVKDERRYGEEDDVLCYDPPGGSRGRRDSRGSGSQVRVERC